MWNGRLTVIPSLFTSFSSLFPIQTGNHDHFFLKKIQDSGWFLQAWSHFNFCSHSLCYHELHWGRLTEATIMPRGSLLWLPTYPPPILTWAVGENRISCEGYITVKKLWLKWNIHCKCSFHTSLYGLFDNEWGICTIQKRGMLMAAVCAQCPVCDLSDCVVWYICVVHNNTHSLLIVLLSSGLSATL